MSIPAQSRAQAADLIAYIDESPSPWHAAASTAQRLQAQGYTQLHEERRWQLGAGGRYFVIRGGSIIAFVLGSESMERTGLRLIGAHTDSPGLRLKPKAAHESCGVLRLGVEVYGGPILATFTDRDLGLAGRVVVRAAGGFETRLLRFDTPLMRLPNLAIHMNREVNEKGLKLDKQTELPLILGIAEDSNADGSFRSIIAGKLDAPAADILTWELAVYDTQKGGLWGADEEFIAAGRLDNLASCHAAVTALLACGSPAATCVCAFFDHEEVGSESAAGAGGNFVSDLIHRIAANVGMDDEARRCALARSLFISADMAHAYHPNFPAAYEPGHKVMVNAGPVIKSNANQRYSTGADSAARFIALCERAGVPYQQYAHRTDLSCGSTIGPIVAARLGMASVDVGSPLWAMHSIRESAGVLDHAHMIAALGAAFKN
ncbi:putative M18 family aminopeptidase 2 [mine drainage metagenome]|uniref:Putative M18 family aminopeptidase 2 n=1 Tax=mine drainage metagenome TaxID=410659 RepID=A0A1J5RLN2_9ZZZZ